MSDLRCSSGLDALRRKAQQHADHWRAMLRERLDWYPKRSHIEMAASELQHLADDAAALSPQAQAGETRCARCGSSGDTYVLCSGCGTVAQQPVPRGEPVAWRWRYEGGIGWHYEEGRPTFFQDEEQLRPEVQPLFASPPAQLPATDALLEILKLVRAPNRPASERLDRIEEICTSAMSSTACATEAPRHTVIGKVSGKTREGDQVPGMLGAICHACGLGYKCDDIDCPNTKPNPMFGGGA